MSFVAAGPRTALVRGPLDPMTLEVGRSDLTRPQRGASDVFCCALRRICYADGMVRTLTLQADSCRGRTTKDQLEIAIGTQDRSQSDPVPMWQVVFV
jgi:hypothetical protein